MPDSSTEPRAARVPVNRPRLGMLVNPIAGMGGAVGLKGTDGAAVLAEAVERGAVAQAAERAALALRAFVALRGTADTEVLTAPGVMGADSARAAHVPALALGSLGVAPTTAADTRRLACALVDAGIDLLLFAGGDGTARDVVEALTGRVTPVMGIPAGVKVQSSVFARGPAAAGRAAAIFLTAPASQRRTGPREVLDLDEAAYRRGEIAPRLFGELLVPIDERRLQARKEPSPRSEVAAAAGAAAGVARRLAAGGRCILGPGSTVRAVADRLGIAKTLVGVDVVDVAPCDGVAARPDGAGDPTVCATMVVADATSAQLDLVAAGNPVTLVVTPIGGQGFILGRGNQQLSPSLLRAILACGGREALVVVATPAKIASLHGRPLLVDCGDAELDAELAGHITIITGAEERTIYRVEPA